uniref:Probable zinc metalloprotease EGY1, chloroplastic isoform X4 n=1 Tax=Elaeis guineensis var. tenera TaxID=51953 RepID=A0A6I9QI72_ELAGV|nr:probable zinc metalloprotease EGY1, chloroplastic isoform X4 [Elaeis guineensis]
MPLNPSSSSAAAASLGLCCRWSMGTALPSSSFLNLNFRFRLLPAVAGACCTQGGNPKKQQQQQQQQACSRCKGGIALQQAFSWGTRRRRRFDGMRCFSIDSGNDGGEEKRSGSTEEVEQQRVGSDELNSERSPPASVSSRKPGISSERPVYSSFQVDSFKLMELLGPEKVDPSDVKRIKEKLFGYSTFWVTREEPFGDLGEGILFLGNLRGKREEVFAKLQWQLHEVMGDKYNLFMVEEPNSEGPDPRGGPRVSFGLLRKEVSEPGPTTLWQYVIALLLFVLTIGSCVELGIASQISSLPPEVVKYFTDPNATEPPNMQLLFPFVESALPLAYGVLGVQLFHEVGHFLAAFPKKVKLGIPYLIPNITLGSFGAITQSHACCNCFNPPSCNCWLVKCGLTTSAFNMLPVGCLDGGRAIQLGGQLSLPWGLYVLICQRTPEKPCLNDVTEVGTWRRTALVVTIFLVVLILLPLWDELAEELGIGLVTSF